MTPATSITNGNTYYLIVNNGTENRILGLRDGAINTDVVQNLNNIGRLDTTRYNLTARANGTTYAFSYGRRGTTYYFQLTESGLTRVTSNPTYFEYDSTIGIYKEFTTTYTPRVKYSSRYYTTDVREYGSVIYLYKFENNTYTIVKDDENYSNNNTLLSEGTYVIIQKQTEGYYIIGLDYLNAVPTHTYIGTDMSSLTSYVDPTRDHVVSTQYGNGYRLCYGGRSSCYLRSEDGELVYTNSTNAHEWLYCWDGVNGINSTLFTVQEEASDDYSLKVDGNYVVTGTGASFRLYTVSGNTLGSVKTNGGIANATNYVIVIYQSNTFYILERQGTNIVPINYGSALPTTVEDSMIFRSSVANNVAKFTCTINSITYYMRLNDGRLCLDTILPAQWTYTYNTGTSVFGITNTIRDADGLYLFKVSKNDELDNVTDTRTLLNNKITLQASSKVMPSSDCIIVAEVDEDSDGTADKYYVYTVKDIFNNMALDITDTFNDALDGKTITVFDASVWNQLGSAYSLLFTNEGYNDSSNYYLLSGALANRSSVEPVVVKTARTEEDLTNFTWRTFQYSDTGTSYYLFGLTDNETIYYLYFDVSDLKFKLTTLRTTAYNANCVVQLYQLGSKSTVDPVFETLNISTAADGITITQYPLTLMEDGDEFETYAVVEDESTDVVQFKGEYMIMSIIDDKYYALGIDPTDPEVQFADVSLFFSGNYSIDDGGAPCLSINRKYIWKQTSNDPTTSLSFTNLSSNYNLYFDNYSLIYENGQLSNAAKSKYLNFDVDNGFSIGNNPSTNPISIYYLGYHGVDTSDSEGGYHYSYYSYGISTSDGSIDYTKFNFNKVHIDELKNYGMTEQGTLDYTVGWKIDAYTEEYLETANDTFYFTDGINYSSNVETFADEFNDYSTSFTIDGVSHEINYYAPDGAIVIVIASASSEEPVFINAIVSTELDSNTYNEDYLRYLALWKVADINFADDPADDTITTLKNYGDGSSVVNNYAYTLADKFNTPNAAIPLPNHYSNVGGSTIKCDDEIYNIHQVANWDHLVAHTFVVSTPGIYYLGSTYGTLAFSYLSITDMFLMADGEAAGQSLGEEFTIDFVWGELDSDATAISVFDEEGSTPKNVLSTTTDYANIDNTLGTIAYVGYVGDGTSDDPSWVHSNIFPMFVNGIGSINAEVNETTIEGVNPTDELTMTIERTFIASTGEDVPDKSKVSVVINTTEAIYNDGKGIVYFNNNTNKLRLTRLVEFTVNYPSSEPEEPEEP